MDGNDMTTGLFFRSIRSYAALTPEAEEAWAGLLKERTYARGDCLVQVGQVPKKVAFVVRGLFSQYYITGRGATVIKYLFPEGRIAGSVPAMLQGTASLFAVEALEPAVVLEYDFRAFKKLVAAHRDIADWYVAYMERHWIIDKEPDEVSLRHDTAAVRYDAFLRQYPGLAKRLKKHQIAAFLGITPTQLSRIFFASK